MIEKNVKVWLGGASGITEHVHVSQYDTGWRFLFSIYVGSTVYQPSTADAVLLEGRKPDGTVFAVPGAFLDGVAVVDCTPSITAAVGKIDCELRVSAGGTTVGTANFVMVVEAAPLRGYIASDDDFSAMQQIIDDASESGADAAASASAAAGSAAAAAASASAAAVSAATAQVQAGMAYKIAATAAAMTDTSIGYVYTGNETGYVNGGWYYYNGSAWTLGGTAVDPTLSIAGAAADAAACGDLKSAITNINARISEYLNTTFEIGNIKTDGTDDDTSTSASNRVRSDFITITSETKTVLSVKPGYNFFVTYYNDVEGTPTHQAHSGWKTSNYQLITQYESFRVVIAKYPDAETVSESEVAEYGKSVFFDNCASNSAEIARIDGNITDIQSDITSIESDITDIESILVEYLGAIFEIGNIKTDGTDDDTSTSASKRVRSDFITITSETKTVLSVKPGYNFFVTYYNDVEGTPTHQAHSGWKTSNYQLITQYESFRVVIAKYPDAETVSESEVAEYGKSVFFDNCASNSAEIARIDGNITEINDEISTIKTGSPLYALRKDPYTNLDWTLPQIVTSCHVHVGSEAGFNKLVSDLGYDAVIPTNYRPSKPWYPLAKYFPNVTNIKQYIGAPNSEIAGVPMGNANNIHVCPLGSYMAFGSESTPFYPFDFDEFVHTARRTRKGFGVGGVIINHPNYSSLNAASIADALIKYPDVLGIEIYNSNCEISYGNGYALDLFDAVLSQGIQCYGFASPDHYTNTEGGTHKPYGFIRVLAACATDDGLLTAIASGAFYAMLYNDTLKITNINLTGRTYTITAEGSNNISIKIKTASGEQIINDSTATVRLTPSTDKYVRSEVTDGTNVCYTNAIILI